MIVVNINALCYQNKYKEKCFHTTEKEKKRKYLEAFIHQCSRFIPIGISVYGLLIVEGEHTLKCLAIHLTTKRKQPYYRVHGYIKSIITIMLVQATHHCIWGYLVLASHISFQNPQWED